MNSIKVNFTIRDLENLSGIKSHTIRIWEKRYNLFNPQRTDTNIRYYTNADLQKLLNVSLLNNHGYKISKIAKMSDLEVAETTKKLSFNGAVSDEAKNAFKMSMFHFDKVLFNTTYNKLLHKKTFREIFKEVFIPFLSDIGVLWQTDTLLPAHEHFISNLISQKIQTNTENLQYSEEPNSKIFVLFLPENEIHDLGLLYLNYELVLRGNRTIYLGQSLPLNNLNYFFESNNDICFVTSLTIQPYDDKLEDYFKKVDEIIRDSKHNFYAIGKKAVAAEHYKFSDNIKIFPSILDVLETM